MLGRTCSIKLTLELAKHLFMMHGNFKMLSTGQPGYTGASQLLYETAIMSVCFAGIHLQVCLQIVWGCFREQTLHL